MSLRLLCAFLDAHHKLPDFLGDRCRPLSRQEAESLGDAENAWDALCPQARQDSEEFEPLPISDWRPDCFLLRLGIGPVPAWVWSLPVPVVSLVEDLACLWHHHQVYLPRCAMAFADPEDAVALRQAGHRNILDCRLQIADLLALPSDISDLRSDDSQSAISNLQSEILLIGLPHRFLQRDGLARTRLWARLGERCRVVCSEKNGEALAEEIRRARVVLVRRGHHDRPLIETCARQAGAIVLLEEETSPVAIERLLEQEREAASSTGDAPEAAHGESCWMSSRRNWRRRGGPSQSPARQAGAIGRDANISWLPGRQETARSRQI